MRPVLVLAAAAALVAAAVPAGAAECGCYHYHHVRHVYRRPARVIYRTRVIVEPSRPIIEAAPAPYYAPRYGPRPFYGPRPYPVYGFGYGHRGFGPYGWRRPYGWRPY